MKRKPAISVIIPAFNEEKYLPVCLISLKQQTFKDFELIVVDNNSTDKTAEIAKKYEAKVVRESNQGANFARKKGIKAASAEIIAATDADATLPPNWLYLIYQTFQLHPRLIALTGTFTSPSRLIPNSLFYLSSFLLMKIGKLLTGHFPLLGANMAIKKSAWEKIKLHFGHHLILEDLDLSCHLAQRGEILFLPQLTASCSLRRLKENFLSAVVKYILVYPLYYAYTLLLHHPYFRRHQSL